MAMAEISMEQIVFQNIFLKKLDLFCIFKFIVTNDLRIYSEKSYTRLLKIINSYKKVNLKSPEEFSSNEKINEYFFYNKEKSNNVMTPKEEYVTNTKKEANLMRKKNYRKKLHLNDSLFAKSLNNKKLFELFKFPREEEVFNYIKSVCKNCVINEPLRLNVSFKKYDKKQKEEEEKDNTNHNIETETHPSPMDTYMYGVTDELSNNELINSASISTSAVSHSGTQDTLSDRTTKPLNGKYWTSDLKKRGDESIEQLINGHSTDASIDFKRFILDSREMNCCSTKIQDDSEAHNQTKTSSINETTDKCFCLNESMPTEKTTSGDRMDLPQEGARIEGEDYSAKLVFVGNNRSLNATSDNNKNDPNHFVHSNKRSSEDKTNINNCWEFNDHHTHNTADTHEERNIQKTNTEHTDCRRCVYKRKRSSNEFSIYNYSVINDENNSTHRFYDDTALCLKHFHDIHNLLNRDPSGLRKIKIMLKDEIATISISPFYINFDGVRVFENVCQAFHLDKDDYKRKRLYYVLKLCMNNESAMSKLKRIFMEDLYTQQENYERELCEKKFTKKKEHRKKNYRRMITLRKKQKSEEQIFEILNEEKRINVLYFINRFLYSQKTPLSNLFENYSLSTNDEDVDDSDNGDGKEDTSQEIELDEQYAFDELTIDYFIFLMIFDNKIEENFYKYLIKKLEQCKSMSLKDLEKAHAYKKQKSKENGANEFIYAEGGDTLQDSEKINKMTDEILLLSYIRPFPTVFWLINKNICAYISHLEKLNIIKNIEKIIKNKNPKFTLLRRYLIYDHLKYILIRTRHINRRILLFFYNNFVNSESFADDIKFDENENLEMHLLDARLAACSTQKLAEHEEKEEGDKEKVKEGEEEFEEEKEAGVEEEIEYDKQLGEEQKERPEKNCVQEQDKEQQSENVKKQNKTQQRSSVCATYYADMRRSYDNNVSVKLMPSEFCEIYNIDILVISKIVRKINTLRINGVGGISNFLNLKCIHLYFASHLSYPNTVGYILEECFKT